MSDSCNHKEFFDTIGFEVYRLYLAGKEWVKVEKLPGDCSLFVSPKSSFPISSSKQASSCIRSNCVYFLGRYCLSCHDVGESTWGVYSMADDKVLFEHAIPSTRATQMIARWFRPSVLIGFNEIHRLNCSEKFLCQ